ncbi:hypothetical protein BV22DRAFT_1124439 [Leucogyrophana mollusca]|uniref:Uncharacterized protein n=1 Tax=Leucogyrophana mollusca TaxID=85980 RepID=A0ACB8C186_9AGAM|nr:hypothetical protein BV22DRAFT_1124439 [Leucogyrophana mollusca]
MPEPVPTNCDIIKAIELDMHSTIGQRCRYAKALFYGEACEDLKPHIVQLPIDTNGRVRVDYWIPRPDYWTHSIPSMDTIKVHRTTFQSFPSAFRCPFMDGHFTMYYLPPWLPIHTNQTIGRHTHLNADEKLRGDVLVLKHGPDRLSDVMDITHEDINLVTAILSTAILSGRLSGINASV